MFYTGKDLDFRAKGKKLFFEYLEYVRADEGNQEAYQVYELTEEIPQKLVKKGNKTAIKEYAEKQIAAYKEKVDKQNKKIEKFEKNPEFPLIVKYKNTILKGKIVSAQNNTLTVKLSEPFQGKEFTQYGFASAMAGLYILDQKSDEIKFSSNAIKTAKNLLIRIYEKEYKKANNPTANLAEKLNE